MEQIKVIQKFDGHKPGKVLTVTSMTAEKRVKDGLAEFVKKEAKEEFETKEEKAKVESKAKKEKVKKNVTKAPGAEPVK